LKLLLYFGCVMDLLYGSALATGIPRESSERMPLNRGYLREAYQKRNPILY